MCFNRRGDISPQNGSSEISGQVHLPRKQCLINRDRHQHTTSKNWTAIDSLSVIWKSEAVVVSILLYGCTTRTLTKQMAKRLDDDYTRMLQAILNKSWRQHPTKQWLYGHLPLITKTIQVRRTRHAGHCWRSKDKLLCDILLWTPSHGRAKVGRPARTYIQQLCADTGFSLEDLPGAMDDRYGWREKVWDIHVAVPRDDDDDIRSSIEVR